MPMPKLEIGRVIDYAYLWKRQERQGMLEGQKNRRPCAVVAAVKQENGQMKAYVMPISHTAPLPGTPAIEIPPEVKDHLGMGKGRSWVFCGEVNMFVWPGFDVQPMPGGRDSYGVLPPAFFKMIKAKASELFESREMKFVNRDGDLKRR